MVTESVICFTFDYFFLNSKENQPRKVPSGLLTQLCGRTDS